MDCSGLDGAHPSFPPPWYFCSGSESDENPSWVTQESVEAADRHRSQVRDAACLEDLPSLLQNDRRLLESALRKSLSRSCKRASRPSSQLQSAGEIWLRPPRSLLPVLALHKATVVPTRLPKAQRPLPKDLFHSAIRAINIRLGVSRQALTWDLVPGERCRYP